MHEAVVTPTPDQRLGMRSAILAQCSGVLGMLAFKYGLILLYLRTLEISSARILVYVSIPFVLRFLAIPVAWYADRTSKKGLGVWGLAVATVGFAVLALAGSFPAPVSELLAVTGIGVYAFGVVAMEASWFALLSPVVPPSMRGRFFGWLRFSWQLVGILFIMGAALWLSDEAPTWRYQVLAGLIVIGQGLRVVFYSRIPELEGPTTARLGLRASIGFALRVPDYAPFCAYVFLLALFTASAPLLFALVAKELLLMGDDTVVWLGHTIMVGSLVGFLAGGAAVDRGGTKPIFLFAHVTYGLIFILFCCRDFVPVPVFGWLCALHLAFGFVLAMSSIAITTELFALLPEEYKTVSAALGQVAYMVGGSLGGLVSAAIVKTGALRETWTWGGATLSQYDTILLGFAMVVILLTVTLGQVPSVLRKGEVLPMGIR